MSNGQGYEIGLNFHDRVNNRSDIDFHVMLRNMELVDVFRHIVNSSRKVGDVIDKPMKPDVLLGDELMDIEKVGVYLERLREYERLMEIYKNQKDTYGYYWNNAERELMEDHIYMRCGLHKYVDIEYMGAIIMIIEGLVDEGIIGDMDFEVRKVVCDVLISVFRDIGQRA